MGFQRPMHVGPGDGALAWPWPPQCRDGSALPGELQQVPGSRVTGALQSRVWAALAEINDPEMPVNLVDLGLIYGVEVLQGTVHLRLTFTAMGCPATDMLMSDIRERLLAEPGVQSVAIDVVWAPLCTAAPSLEADIAAAAMGLDDIGHSRVLYGSLRELGAADAASDHGDFANVPYLDTPWKEWSQFVAANAVLDSAFTLMIEALANGSVEVFRSRLRKIFQEERYHGMHGE